VEVLASGTWPGLCAQLARVDQRLEGMQFTINLLATPEDPDCPPDQVGLPFRLALPLNMVEMPVGNYTVIVNGVEAGFGWDPAAPPVGGEPPVEGSQITYIGSDGNVWAMSWPGGEPRPLTTDAVSEAGGAGGPSPTINYYFPRISSDGQLVAYRRDVGTPITSGMDYQFGLWVYDLNSGEGRQVLDENPAGFAWRPGTHLLAYGVGVAEEYFMSRGEGPDASLAQGVWGIDLDTGERMELVKPDRGYALYLPAWSRDGRFLAFEELLAMEGRGNFAYYDFESQEYRAWEEAIGLFDWSPDGEQIAYDRLTYVANGSERIFLRERQVEGERQLSPDDVEGYAFSPVYSPQGDRIAYLAGLAGVDSQIFTLFVQDLAGGEPRELGVFESVLSLNWSPEGTHLIFSAGPYDRQQLSAVNLADGTSAVLAEGSQPDVSR
jgi:Tol biopolymer transport system component